jgi:hypothetical protein
VERAALLVWAMVLGDALAFFAPFALLRLRRLDPAPILAAGLALAGGGILVLGITVAALTSALTLSVIWGLGFLALAIAAAARRGWRFLAPVGGALGLLVLALMAWGPLHPLSGGPRAPPLPPMPPTLWALLLAGTLLLFAPRRRAIVAAVALLWWPLVIGAWRDARGDESLHRTIFMAPVAFVALAALASWAVPARAPEPPPRRLAGRQVRALAACLVGACLVLTGSSYAFAPRPSPTPPVPHPLGEVVLTQVPASGPPNATVTVCWHVNGTGTIPETGIRANASDGEPPSTYYPDNATQPSRVSLPHDLCTGVRLPATGILYVRAYARTEAIPYTSPVEEEVSASRTIEVAG